MNSIIATDNISKYYGKLAAVNNVSLNVSEGEIYGFLGLNGAGKTTMIRMLLGMIKPSEGKAYINGNIVNAGNYKLWENVGYMVEMPNAYPELTVYENLEIARKLRNIKDNSASKRIIEKLALTEHINKRSKALSLGNKQRLGIAKALIHMPKILILDEPTNGLDPAGIVEIRNLLKDLAANMGITILISSHLLGEISKTASRIGIIHGGKLISEFNAYDFENLREKTVLIEATDNNRAKSILLNNGYNITESKSVLTCCDEKAVMHPEKIAEVLVKNECPPKSLFTKNEELESYFFRIIAQKEV
ncbi:ABC transporter ATP-binding protein [Clostridium kluyveri]|uniref:Bacitracin ABC transporter ATP-binding protein n=1 Tax=Clostridium kluyveri TaxID=1534 RepID=A0A1L5FD40_CLOKL|nr:ABC transporter ATP-binding protein [Clostridium kluyveri]APM40897.1 bacitracin ABC transporter ATP-binding protein [Clostridium kluyveri]